MSSFPLRKKSLARNDMNSTIQGTALKKQDFHEVNKRRTFLQDNSWIKRRPEEEKDENYGRVVLNRHNSHDALHRKINEKEEPKAMVSRYRSDDTLDRISGRKDAAKTSKANTLDNQLTNRSMSTCRSSDATKLQPASSLSANTTNGTSSTLATSPLKKKRQSWFPPPPPGYSTAPSMGASRRDPAVHPPIPPKPSSPISSPKPPRKENRTQDLDGIVKVTTSLQETDKGKELDNVIKMNKSLNRNQGLDGLFRANWKAEQTEKRASSLENLIYVNTQMDKDFKGNQSLGSLNKVNQRTGKNEKGRRDLESITKVYTSTDETSRGKQDFDELTKVNLETNKNIKSSRSLGNLIEVSTEGNRNRQGFKDLNNLKNVSPTIGKCIQGGQSLDCLIKVVPETNQGNQDLNNLIKLNPSANKCEQDVDKLINVNPKAVKNTAGNQNLDNLIKVNPLVTRNNQSLDVDYFIQVKPSVLRNVNRLDSQVNGFTSALHNKSTRVSTYSYEARHNLSSSTGSRHARPKDIVVYTRTFVENSKTPKDGYQENSSGKYIQTVYSTSDRSVIEKDMCTYCRKPLGVETKMILDELQICCHSTCFKCEICKRPLENLKAGDSIWIYRQTIHCEPCYSKVMAKWIQ
ncbi:sciellin isoform X2 [Heterocephalus glaber]|uniref:Sciellin n=1 Tax=Heterocephalus glaber TaxID=10181 RepID=A0AAX6T1E4_HETGA|nr:sciellin isoform X2 [Heterocephalus glaber]